MSKPLWQVETKREREAAPTAVTLTERDNAPPSKSRVKRERAVIHAFLNASSEAVPDVANSYNDRPYYVIIGCGFAATVDHATLVQSTWGVARLGKLDVLHIGFPDPWRTYHKHNMNQEIELLTLPGYSNQPDEGDTEPVPDDDGAYRWLLSTSFAQINRDEISGLVTEAPEDEEEQDVELPSEPVVAPLGPVRAMVSKIEPPHDDEQNYVITLYKSPEKIKAAMIDICTGPGQGRTKYKAPQGLTSDLTRHSESPFVPKLYTATNITLENAKMAKGGLILIRGAGPAAAQAVERALEETDKARQILWIGKDINSSFPGTLRLDWLVKSQHGALPPRTGLPGADLDLSPTPENLWIADGYEIESMEEVLDDDPRWQGIVQWKEAGKVLRDPREGEIGEPARHPTVLVKFVRQRDAVSEKVRVPRVSRPSACRDSEGNVIPEIVWGLFHQVIVATGLENAVKDTGSGFAFAQALAKDTESKQLTAKRTGDKNLFVGFESNDHRVRWLGGAGHGSSRPAAAKKSFLEFESTLPAQARIFQQGVTLCALTIAHANRWFTTYHQRKATDPTVNRNVNTASYAELSNSVGERHAQAIHQIRTMRTRPFVSEEQVARAIVYYELNNGKKGFASTTVTDSDLRGVGSSGGTASRRITKVQGEIEGKLLMTYDAAEYGDRTF
jgi:hypothetical protein